MNKQQFFAGDVVEIHSLTVNTEYNGRIGIVDQVTWKTVYVKFGTGGEVVRVQPENLRKPTTAELSKGLK